MIGLLLLALSGVMLAAVIAMLWVRARLSGRPRALLACALASALLLGIGGVVDVWKDRSSVRQHARSMAADLQERWEFIRYRRVDGLSFTDITRRAGTAGPTAPGTTGGHGVFWADVDGSGLPDLYITMNWDLYGPMADLFFRNDGNGRFAEEGAARGIDDFDGGSHGACFADFSNNGHYDLYNGATLDVDGSYGVNRLYRNDGRGRFDDVTEESRLPGDARQPTRAVLCFDITGNGWLDLFALSGYLGTDDPPHYANQVHLNRGDMRFDTPDSSVALHAKAGQGAIDTDINGDGFIDIVAANRTGAMLVLLNDGDGNFTQIDPESIGIRHRAGDGIAAADVNRSGHQDLLLTGAEGIHLYFGNGDGTFRHQQSFDDIDRHVYMGGFADLNNNGHVDLVLAGVNRVYLNDGAGRFVPGPALSLRGVDDPRAVAFADIDGDGSVDFALAAKRSGNRLFRNDSAGGNWLKVRLVSPQGQAGAFGARVYLRDRDAQSGLLGTREARSNHGYLAQDDPVLHFGLGDVDNVDVEVHFPDGTVITREAVAAGQTVTVDGRVGRDARRP